MQSLPILTEWEEERVAAVLQLLRDQVIQRRVMVYPYFKDYERVSASLQGLDCVSFQIIFLWIAIREEIASFIDLETITGGSTS